MRSVAGLFLLGSTFAVAAGGMIYAIIKAAPDLWVIFMALGSVEKIGAVWAFLAVAAYTYLLVTASGASAAAAKAAAEYNRRLKEPDS